MRLMPIDSYRCGRQVEEALPAVAISCQPSGNGFLLNVERAHQPALRRTP